MMYAMAILFTSDRRAPATTERLQVPLQVAEQHWRAEHYAPKLGEVLALRSWITWMQGAHQSNYCGPTGAWAVACERDAMARGQPGPGR